MSCYGCSKKYGLFCKEYGCPNCGYSYCAKCLKRPVAVPRHGGKVLNVCLICFDKLSKLQAQASEKVIDCEALPGTLITKPVHTNVVKGDAKVTEEIGAASIFEDDPPTDLGEVLKPISASGSPQPPSAATHSSSDNAEINENLDSVISKRLKNLKAVEDLPTDDEIRSRLANLNGMPQKEYSKKDLLLSTDKRTDQEKMKDLLEQFMGESQIDKKVETERNDAISEIERRLKALRDTPIESGTTTKSTCQDTNTPSDNEQDEETVLKGIIEKYLAESRLPEGPSNLEKELEDGLPRPPKGTDTEELPWCTICNEDAVFRCKGCDGDLFCAQCFRECHDDDEEYREHVKENYSAPPKFKENHF